MPITPVSYRPTRPGVRAVLDVMDVLPAPRPLAHDPERLPANESIVSFHGQDDPGMLYRIPFVVHDQVTLSHLGGTYSSVAVILQY